VENKNYLWNASVNDIVKGYEESSDAYLCLFCERKFEKGLIFTLKDTLYDAYGAVNEHCKAEHGFTVDYLLSQELSLIGISEVQQQILKLMSEGKDDKTISSIVGIALSTVRNHRFKLREKEKQAKLFLALMQSLEDKTSRSINQSDAGVIEEIHQSATMIDDRYNITDDERNKVIKAHMNENGALIQFPAKEKKKIIILREIMKNFKHNQNYHEKDINRTLERIYSDYAALRRALIEYGFLERSDDGSVYRVKE
jgi:hypothetical protein